MDHLENEIDVLLIFEIFTKRNHSFKVTNMVTSFFFFPYSHQPKTIGNNVLKQLIILIV